MHLFVANFQNASCDRLRSMLNEAQNARLNTFHHRGRADQYFWSRVLYNGLIKRLTGKDVVGDLPKNQPHPAIAFGEHQIFTSLSHSDHWVCVGYDIDHHVGVDIELAKPRAWESLSEIAFNEVVQKDIRDAEDPLLTFYCYWGLTECRYKLAHSTPTDTLTSTVKVVKGVDAKVVVSALGTNPEKPTVTFLTETLLENW